MEEFIKKIKKATRSVDKELDRALYFTESNYQSALLHFFQLQLPSDVSVNREVHINYSLTDGHIIGSGRADIILENSTHSYILELKSNVDIKYLRKYIGQTLRYVRNYKTNKTKIGVLIVFNSHCHEPLVKILK